MIQSYMTDDAPSYAKHSSSFKNDERCTEVHYVIGDHYDEVLKFILKIYQALDADLSDYDVNWSSEGEKFVGVTCRDV